MKEIKERLNKWALDNYLKLNLIDVDDVFYTVTPDNDDIYMLTYPKEGKILDKDVCFILDDDEINILEGGKIKFILFEFGKRFYYTKLIPFKNEFNDDGCYEVHFNDFKLIGEANLELELQFVNLGVHSQYELLNGSNNASLWAKKAKFLKQPAIGLCDKNTLGGTLPFQSACQKEKLKYIIGETITIVHNYDPEAALQETNELKLYVQNEEGWQNLLQINRQIKVVNDGFTTEEFLLDHSTGLICVFSLNSILNSYDNLKDGLRLIKKYEAKFGAIYYQIDSVEFFEDEADIKNLKRIEFYLKNFYKFLKPVLINDSYYVEKDMHILKDLINKVSRKVHDDYSREQHFKNVDEIFEKLAPLFGDEDKFLDLFSNLCANTVLIADLCDFEIETKFNKLPVYQNDFDEDLDNLDLFFQLIQKGIDEKLVGKDIDMEIYEARIAKEAEVIVNAGIVDYFLILWDVVKWCKEGNIYVGPGRGSVAGSLIAYLVSITEVDPIKHDLLFERFLNQTRFTPDIFYVIQYKDSSKKEIKEGTKILLKDGKEILVDELKKEDDKNISKIETVKKKRGDAMPDVDLDFETEHRDSVKQYIRERFGVDFVCSVGSYGTFKLKGAIKDFSKVKGLDFQKMNFITKGIDDQIDYNFRDLLKYAQKSYELKKFLNEYQDIFHAVKYALGQTKTASIHASAMLIVPSIRDNKDANIYNWLPLRKENGLLVSEWEGKYTDIAGFLKEDILGLNQLDKLHHVNILLKKNGKEAVNWNELLLDDENVYAMFHKGFNEDVFQFNSAGLKSYSIKVRPDNFEDITAMTALFRPGPMSSNAHTDFADFKHKIKKPKFDFGLKEVTEKTQGLYVYQEQIMKAVMVLGGFSAVESENTRTKIKKFQKEEMEKVGQQFVTGAIERGCAEEEAWKIWKKLLAFSGYGFNRSHSVAYTLMSYWSQWAKVHFPLEFWATSLQYAPEDDISRRISEMRKTKNGISIKPPDINYSEERFVCNDDTNTIFWGINKIKGLGASTTPRIIAERELNGKYLSYDNLKSRVPKKEVNKAKLLALILSGGFDSVEGISFPEERLDLVKKHFESYKESLPERFLNPLISKRYFWVKIQKELTGFGNIDFQELLNDNPNYKKYSKTLVEGEKFHKLKDYDECSIIGEILFLDEKNSKNGTWLRITMMSNNDMISINIWNDVYEKYKEILTGSQGKMLLFTNGKIKYSEYQGFNVLNSSETTFIGEV